MKLREQEQGENKNLREVRFLDEVVGTEKEDLVSSEVLR